MSEWKPIKTASMEPDKYGLTPRMILACPPVNASGWTIAEGYWRWSGANPGWVSCMDPDVGDPYLEPTHWMPLPEPPK
jgi:hypothetical protein